MKTNYSSSKVISVEWIRKVVEKAETPCQKRARIHTSKMNTTKQLRNLLALPKGMCGVKGRV